MLLNFSSPAVAAEINASQACLLSIEVTVWLEEEMMYGAAVSFPACARRASLRNNAIAASVTLEMSQSYHLPTHESTSCL